MSRLLRRGPRSARGAITWVTALLLLLAGTAGYLAWVWVPVYYLHYEVRSVVRDFGNQAIKNPADADLVQKMCAQIRGLSRVSVPDGEGGTAVQPAANLQPQDVTWERNAETSPPTLHVAFEYRRDVYYPFLDRWEEKTMRVDETLDLTRADWGGALK